MSNNQTIAKNTLYLTMALVAQKIISYLFFIIIARTLGKTGIGEYVAAFAYASLCGVIIDAGLSNVLVRELARDQSASERLFRNVVGLKIVFGLLSLAVLTLIVWTLPLFGLNPPDIQLVMIALFAVWLDSVMTSAYSVFRGWQNLTYEAIATIVQKVGILIVGLLVLSVWPSPFNLVVATILGAIFAYGLVFKYLHLKISHPLWPLFDWGTQKYLLQLTRPFALAAFFAVAYSYFDSILLNTLAGSEAVGLYSVASKTMNAFIFIPSAFMAAVYPAMSVSYLEDKTRLSDLLYTSWRYLLIIGAPIATGLYLVADQFVNLVGADYQSSALAIKLLMPSLVMMFLTYPLGSLLNGTNHQRWQTFILGVGLTVNIVLNLWAIPRFGFIGASITWSVTNLLMLCLGVTLVSQIIKFPYKKIAGSLLRILLSIIVMSLTVHLLHNYSLLIIIPLAGLIYFISIVLLKELRASDISYFNRLRHVS